MLVYNIFPGCNTSLHYAFQKPPIIKGIYDYSVSKEEPFEVPFIKNLKGESPLHLCLKKKEFKTADLLLQKLADAPLDHHGRVIIDVLHEAISQGLESVGDYIDKRFIQTEQIKQIRRGNLNIQDNLNYACVSSQIWMDIKEIENGLFKESPVE